MIIQCLVRPKSKVDNILLNADGSLRVKIKAPPVDGKANEYLVKYLAAVFALPPNCIRIVSGFMNSHKRINIVAEDKYMMGKIDELKPKI